MAVKSDIEIAREAKMKPIAEVGKKIGIPDGRAAELRALQGQGLLRLHQLGAEEQGRQADPGHRHQPDAGGRRQDHDDGRSRRRPQPHRQEGHELPARALAWALLRREGWRGRRRLRSGRADGGYQPPLHGRLPRHHVGAQPALGTARQPHLLGQCAGARCAPHCVAPRHGHERPRAAVDRQLARRHRQRLPARGRLRHHRRIAR